MYHFVRLISRLKYAKGYIKQKILAIVFFLYARYYQTVKLGFLTWIYTIINIFGIAITFYLCNSIENYKDFSFTISEIIFVNNSPLDNTNSSHTELSPFILVSLFVLCIAFNRNKPR